MATLFCIFLKNFNTDICVVHVKRRRNNFKMPSVKKSEIDFPHKKIPLMYIHWVLVKASVHVENIGLTPC